jgi:hypothetical protein
MVGAMRRVAVIATVVLACGVAAGCGRRGAPVVPRTAPPEPVASLAAIQEGNSAILTWTRPSRYEDGTPLRGTPDYLLYRRAAPLPAPPAAEGARDLEGFTLLATIRGERPENARVDGSAYAFHDEGGGPGLAYGQRYEYRLVARDRRGYPSQPSNLARVDLLVAAGPPQDLQAVAGEGRVDLRWTPPTTRADGTPLPRVQGYNIFRSEQAGAFPAAPINPLPVAEPRYTDGGLTNDHTYYYAVRAVENEAPPWREGANSAVVAVTPRDVTPPAPPRNLEAAVSRAEVALIWDRNEEPDLLGYHLYRSEISGTGYQRLTTQPVTATTFTDRTIRRGTTYYYTATAVDTAAIPNESTFADQIAVHVP